MTALLAPFRRAARNAEAAITAPVTVACDRAAGTCGDAGHPFHEAIVTFQPVRVADIRFRVSVTLAGRSLRAPWNFSDRTAALTKFSELVGVLRHYAAAAETLAEVQS